jgi:Ca2+-binding EF-hand superfamily protein
MQTYNEVSDRTSEELRIPEAKPLLHSSDEKTLDTTSTCLPSNAGRRKKSLDTNSKASSSKHIKQRESISTLTAPDIAPPSNVSNHEKKRRKKSDARILRQARFGPYSRDDVYNIYKTFKALDKDGGGSITMKELLNEGNFFGGTHLQDNIMSIFSSIDKDQSGQIDFLELCSVIFPEATSSTLQEIDRFCTLLNQIEAVEEIKEEKKKELKPEELEELKALFHLYDVDQSGGIDVEELMGALKFNNDEVENTQRDSMSRDSMSPKAISIISKEEMLQIMEKYDANENKVLDLDEFIEFFRDVF